jgi:hypothetical protein
MMLSSACLPSDVQCAAADSMWHPEGDFVGLALERHHLPLPRVDPDAIVVAPSADFVRAELSVGVVMAAGANAPVVKRLIKAVVRQLVHPLHGGPGPLTTVPTELLLADIRAAVKGISGVADVALALQADRNRLLVREGQTAGLRVEPGEILNLRVDVAVVDAQP